METSPMCEKKKPHAVCIPLPFQSHITAMLKLAKILHFKGFHITFVNTEFNHQRILTSRGPDSLVDLPGFRFETIPDGLPPPSDINATQDILPLLDSITKTALGNIRSLIAKLNRVYPPVSCIISDCDMTCTIEAAQQLGIPQVLLWPMSASSFTVSHHSHLIRQQCLLKDKLCLTKEYLDTPVNFIPGLKKFRLRDLSSFLWDENEEFQKIFDQETERASRASAIILNTFDSLETEVLDAIKSQSLTLPAIYTLGPLQFLEQQIPEEHLTTYGSNLLKEDQNCVEWLDSRQPNSVLYVNFGSTTVITREHLNEFAWGLANSKHPFVWVIRPDLVIGEEAVLPAEFIQETADRSMISGWCPQEKVLGHSSIAGFLTHCGWNSIMDAMCAGVPIICWPFFGDQLNNCRNACVHWDIGLEIDKSVRREEVEQIVRELLEGEKGKEMKRKSMEWKKKAEESTNSGGSSYVNLDKLIEEVLLHRKLD